MLYTPRMREVEAEFGEPIRDVIVGLRETCITWRNVAGAMDIGFQTLREWRIRLGIAIDGARVCDETSSKDVADRRIGMAARDLGYVGVQDAIADMRMVRRMTLRECAKALGVSPPTVAQYAPSGTMGFRNYSGRGLAVLQESMRRAQRVSVERRKRWHPWDHP